MSRGHIGGSGPTDRTMDRMPPRRVRAVTVAALRVLVLVQVFIAGCGRKTPDSAIAVVRDGGPRDTAQGTTQEEALAMDGRASAVTPPEEDGSPGGTQTTPSGLRMLVIRRGSGTDHPALSDRVKVHYTGWKKDGSIFDSSRPRGEPGLFTLTQVIPGWTEALELMVEGEERKLWIPAKLAYGDHPQWRAPGGDLTYEIELVEIIHSPKRPEDVAAPPATATVTVTGLSYRVLHAGSGKVHPGVNDTILVHYSGWTTDGLLFDSTKLRSGPATFLVGSLIKGWSEAAMLMVVGDRTRFWMPADLAYGDHPQDPDAPSGMLVFDIELLQIR